MAYLFRMVCPFTRGTSLSPTHCASVEPGASGPAGAAVCGDFRQPRRPRASGIPEDLRLRRSPFPRKRLFRRRRCKPRRGSAADPAEDDTACLHRCGTSRQNVFRLDIHGLLLKSSSTRVSTGSRRGDCASAGAVKLLVFLDDFEGWEPRACVERPVVLRAIWQRHRAHRDRRRRTVAPRHDDVRFRRPAQGAGRVLPGAERSGGARVVVVGRRNT